MKVEKKKEDQDRTYVTLTHVISIICVCVSYVRKYLDNNFAKITTAIFPN